MCNKEVIEQLKSLKAHCESMKESGEEWEKDVQALEYAIEELERTAQQVSVQEQYETREVLNEELNINIDVKCIDLTELKEIVDTTKDILKKECNCTCTLNVKIGY